MATSGMGTSACCCPDERFDGFGAFEAILSQEMRKGLFDLGLALLGGKVEDAQICTVGTPWGMMGSQGCRRPSGSGWWETGPHGSDSFQTHRAYAPASR